MTGITPASGILDAALALAAADIPVFPLRADKRPACENGLYAASTDPAEIARLFADPLAALIGVPAGAASGFDAIDVDVKRGGLEWLAANEHRLPVTRRHHTRSGGVHLLLQHSPGMRTKFDRIAPGVEVRGEGGYIVWWPAHGFHAEGKSWAAWPEWLLVDALRGARHGDTAAPAPADLAPPSTPERSGAEALLSLLRAMPNPADITRGEYVALNLAVAGCLRALESLGAVDPEDAEDIRDAAAEWSARWDSATASDVETERARWESDWSIRTHDVSGWRHVLAVAERCGADTSAYRHAAAVAEFGTPALEAEESGTIAPAAVSVQQATPAVTAAVVPVTPDELTEDSVARGFARQHRNLLAYDHSAKRWCMFDGAVWQQDDRGRGAWAVREYVAYARAVFGNTDKSAAGVSFAANVERAARSDPALAVSATVWDTDPWLLGVPGGIVDLRTGRVTPGDAGKYIARQCAVAPAGTPTPLWSAFLDHATGRNAEYQTWLQRLTGYCLTGDVTEEILAFFYGVAGTGKGTFIHTMSSILDAYGYQAPADMLRANPRVNPEYQMAKIAGRRVVFASETESGTTLAEALIKELTGNEGKINARAPFGEPFEFRMQAKPVLVSNFAPKLRGRSDSMERRLRVVPFEHKPSVVDPDLKERLVAEYPGILRWMVDGCVAWQRQRLGWCDVVRRASAAYFEDQDSFGRWVAERVDLAAGARAKRTDLFSDYSVWSRAAGETAVSATEFYETLRRSLPACGETKSNGVRYVVGVALRSATEPAQDGRNARRGTAAADFGISAADVRGLVN